MKSGITQVLALALLLSNVSACGPSFQEKQETLAKTLGVDVNTNARSAPFPLGYFIGKLPGSTLEEAHRLIQGYEAVYHCGGNIEVYYYYSTNDNDALRMQVGYDDDKRVIRADGEDSNSRVISIKGCPLGRLGE